MKFITTIFAAASLMLSAGSAFAETPVEFMSKFYQIADQRPFVPEKLAAFFADKFVDHDPQPGASGASGESMAGFFGALAAGSPDSKHVIEYIEPVGDTKALVRWQYVGTHSANMFGFPASGNSIDISGMELWEFTGGKISSLWHVEELATLFQQLSKK